MVRLGVLLASGALMSSASVAGQKPLCVSAALPSQFVSCEETPGRRWTPCGDKLRQTSGLRDPALGQSCCDTDNGYRDAGAHCGVIAGRCHLEDIRIPPARVVAVQEEIHASGLNATPSTSFNLVEISSQTDSSSPSAQISIEKRRRGTLEWMLAGIGVVGLFMFTC